MIELSPESYPAVPLGFWIFDSERQAYRKRIARGIAPAIYARVKDAVTEADTGRISEFILAYIELVEKLGYPFTPTKHADFYSRMVSLTGLPQMDVSSILSTMYIMHKNDQIPIEVYDPTQSTVELSDETLLDKGAKAGKGLYDDVLTKVVVGGAVIGGTYLAIKATLASTMVKKWTSRA